MKISRRSLLKNSAAAAAAMTFDWRYASAQAETIRIGVIYDLSGPFAAGGSVASAIGAQIAIDFVNERGGVDGKYKVAPVNADSQSKADVAINEVERLINQEKVDIIDGVYSSAHAVPIVRQGRGAEEDPLDHDRGLDRGVQGQEPEIRLPRADPFRPIWRGVRGLPRRERQGEARHGAKDVKVAIIHEDGPYGVGVAEADEHYSKEAGLQVVLREGYSATAPDLSSLVTKLKRADADVISHAGYNPDITLFLRQARESGLRFKMLVGDGAGYSQLDKLRATFGKDIDNFCNIDPVPAQLLDPKKLAPGIGDLIKIMVERYKAKTNATDVPPHCSMGFNQTWVLLNNVLPVAKAKYGGFDPEAVRKAALDVDIPSGRHHPGLRREVLPARHADVRPERALDAGGDAECRRAHLGRVADQHPDPGGRAAAAEVVGLRHVADDAGGRGADQALRRIPGGQPGVLRSARGRDSRPHRAERLGQEHDVQPDRGQVAPERRLDPLRGRGDRRPGGACDLPSGHRAHVPDSAPVPQALADRERDARRLLRPGRKHRRGGSADDAPRRRSASSACRPTRRRRPAGSAPPR